MIACEICVVLFPYINSCVTRGKMIRFHTNHESVGIQLREVIHLKIDKNVKFEYFICGATRYGFDTCGGGMYKCPTCVTKKMLAKLLATTF